MLMTSQHSIRTYIWSHQAYQLFALTTGNPLKNNSQRRDYPSNKTERHFDYTDINALQNN